MPRRTLKWLAGSFAILLVLILVTANLTNWNWLRDPISRQTAEKTGRTLSIGGDLEIDLGWPRTHIRMAEMTFSNPAWAREKNMVAVRNVALDVMMMPLFRGDIVLDYVGLDHATVFLEKGADGRKNWLLDRKQRNDAATLKINHLAIKDGRIGFDDARQKTRLLAEVTTTGEAASRAESSYPLRFRVDGKYKGLALAASGKGASVLALRDEKAPYRFQVKGRVDAIEASATGSVTNLIKPSAVDLNIRVQGTNLAELYPLLGIVLPDTPPYTTAGHLVRNDAMWRYEKFSGKIGNSDIAGSLQVETGRKRPYLTAKLHSKKLDFSDLGPLVGAPSSRSSVPVDTPPPGRLLPVTPFRTDRWNRMNADVTLKADSIKRDKSLPINDLSTRLQLRDAVLTLNPLKLGIAGGTLDGSVKLDGSQSPIRAETELKVRRFKIAELFPTFDLNKTSIGQVDGIVRLQGRGESVAAMLGSANGHVAMLVDGGEISKLMMETVSLHLLEMLQLKIAGDEAIKLHCGIADFEVKKGVMQASTVLLDTAISRINATGDIDLGEEALDLTLTAKTKKLSLVALRTPIRVTGSFSTPNVEIDKGKLAVRGLGAIALGVVNPLLALLPLVDTGSGKDSDCGRLLNEAKVNNSQPGNGAAP